MNYETEITDRGGPTDIYIYIYIYPHFSRGQNIGFRELEIPNLRSLN